MTFKVLFVTPELEDYIRVGGLASVSAALPRSMKSRVDIGLLLPGYRGVLSQLQSLEIVGRLSSWEGCPPVRSAGLPRTMDFKST